MTLYIVHCAREHLRATGSPLNTDRTWAIRFLNTRGMSIQDALAGSSVIMPSDSVNDAPYMTSFIEDATRMSAEDATAWVVTLGELRDTTDRIFLNRMFLWMFTAHQLETP